MEVAGWRLSRRDVFVRGANLGLALTGLSFVGCGPQPVPVPGAGPAKTDPAAPKKGGILTLTLFQDPPHFDIQQESTILIQAPIGAVYSQLIAADPMSDSKIVGDLAESWEVAPDGRTYTFKIRQGVKFHDNTPLTSDDIRWNLERLTNPPQNFLSPRKALMSNVAAIEAPDATTLRISLKKTQASFLQVLANGFNVIYPRAVVEAKGDMKKTAVGSGPFRLKAYTPGVSLELERNPDYYLAGQPYLDGIQWFLIKDTQGVTSSIKTGRIHLGLATMHNVGPKEGAALKQEVSGLTYSYWGHTILTALNFNLNKAPWNDKRVRAAFHLAIERKALIQAVEGGEGGKIGTFLPPGPFGLTEDEAGKLPGLRASKDEDLAEARRLLAEADFPNGLKLTIPLRNVDYQIDPMTLIKDQLSKVGIDATLQPMESGAHKQLLFSGNFDVVFHMDALTMVDPDIGFRELFGTKSGKNYGGYSNPAVDALLEQQAVEPSVEQRKKLVREMDQIALADMPRVPIYWKAFSTIVSPQVRNWSPDLNGVFVSPLKWAQVSLG
ncbi:MAG: ABC transporter substrate-binding protein [Chloroflexi bacterium]|nr:ABC transporter substrate-binding protein [Chloroflexota bacterium]